jgi:phage-related protein
MSIIGKGTDRKIPKPALKPLTWLGSTKKDLMSLPEEVIDTFGYALHLAQRGLKHPDAKPMHGFGAGVLEVIENQEGDTYRAVYVVRFESTIFVVHVFKKKSVKGDETPKPDLELIKKRLKVAEEIAKEQRK